MVHGLLHVVKLIVRTVESKDFTNHRFPLSLKNSEEKKTRTFIHVLPRNPALMRFFGCVVRSD